MLHCSSMIFRGGESGKNNMATFKIMYYYPKTRIKMKTRLLFPLLLIVPFFISCSDEDSIGGEQSPMGEVGVTVSSFSIEVYGVSDISGEVVGLDDGVSVYSGSAVVTNENMRNILANFPGTEIDGDTVTITGLEFKQTDQGIESVTGLAKGIIVNYESEVGDEYPTSDGVRKVISKSTEDEFFYGGLLIKATEIEETPNKYGVKKIKYWANHRFGLVGIEFTFDDGTKATFPIYTSAQN